MHGLGLRSPETPSPLSLFMNILCRSGGELSFDPLITRSGDTFTFETQLGAVVVFSACPQDIRLINGTAGQPAGAHFQIFDSDSRHGGDAE